MGIGGREILKGAGGRRGVGGRKKMDVASIFFSPLPPSYLRPLLKSPYLQFPFKLLLPPNSIKKLLPSIPF
jgi:hypothetical protein